MNETGHNARDTFSTGSEDVSPRLDSLDGVQDGAALRPRGRCRVRVLVAAGLTAALAAAGVTAALLAGSGSGASSPLAAVTGALAETSAASYSFGLDTTVQVSGRQVRSSVVSGEFDPRHALGSEIVTTSYENHPVEAQIRFIGNYLYTWVSPASGLGTVGKPWNKSPVPPAGGEGSQGVGAYGFVSDQPVSPAELSGVLLSAGAVGDAGSASGPGWTGTKYTFTARIAGESVSATVYVDRQGRVRRMVTITRQDRLATDRELTFDDFGAQEAITAPPASQAEYTSNPYWGFYF